MPKQNGVSVQRRIGGVFMVSKLRNDDSGEF